MIKNPVLKGFNPDPSAVKVGNTIYIATSSFLWMPGVRIYETTDLVNYKFTCDPLTKINMEGIPLDCGIWAPQISYVDDMFYLVYTIVTSTKRPFKDQKNYLITAKNIKGPWSKPILLTASGFDPSFYHEGSKSYLLNTLWDYRLQTPNKSAGIVMQEYDRKTHQLIGESKHIFNGTAAAKTEASHIYKFNDYYYLITAEGGTGSDHQVTVCRAKNIWGPYEEDPKNPILTAKDNPDLLLQCSGHGSIIEFNNKLYMYHLMTRDFLGQKSMLGRESAVQPIVLKDDWIRLDSHNADPLVVIKGDFARRKPTKTHFYQDFSKKLSPIFNTLRKYDLKNWTVKTNDGLKVLSGESIQSQFNLHLLGYRQTSFEFDAYTNVSFIPNSFNDIAALSLYLNEENYIHFMITKNNNDEIIGALHYKVRGESIVSTQTIKINQFADHVIEVSVRQNMATFICDGVVFPQVIESGFLNTGFTGNFITLSVHNLNYFKSSAAVFKDFYYQEVSK